VRGIVGVTALVALLGAGLVAYRALRRDDSPKVPEAGRGRAAGETRGPVTSAPRPAAPAPRRQGRFYVNPREVPPEFRGFGDWSQVDRLNAVTAQMENKNLPPAVLEFFKAEIFNRQHWDVTRNNMANALVWQEKPDRNLHKLFIQMLDDEQEDPVWRDYCLQFLSECLSSSVDPDLITSKLQEYSQKSGTNMAGTATVHLAYQEGLGRVKLDAAFSEQLARQLQSPEVTDATKLSILGVAGKRKDQRLLPVVRDYAKQDANDSLKRTAIASLGLIGDPSDLELIRSGLKHRNQAVQMAAQAALERLAKNAMPTAPPGRPQ
jgi:HEAT repeat protein